MGLISVIVRQKRHICTANGAVPQVFKFVPVNIGKKADGYGFVNIKILAEPTGNENLIDG